MNDNIKVYKVLNSILIVDNGIKKIVNDNKLFQKSDNQIIDWYKNNIKNEKERGDDVGLIK